jgi:O-acetyl-ADP-ribose deacetylase (regulator of RNase III)
MTVTVRPGDLFRSDAQTLVNTVNTVGVMGKGIALEFKKRFPEMYVEYVQRCQANQVRAGEPYLYRRLTPPWIINFPTKEHWRSVARLSDIVLGLEYLEAHCKEWEVTSLAVPALGCGLGQLEWRVVGPILYRHLSTLEIPVELFAPSEATDEEVTAGVLGGI